MTADPAGSPRSRFPLIPFDDVEMGTEPRYLVHGIFPVEGLAVIWGPPKSGKSFWMFGVAMHVALGWHYRGRTVQQGPVVYCAFEGQSGFKIRIGAFREEFPDVVGKSAPFYLQPVTMDLVTECEDLIRAIEDQIHAHPAMVVLDTLNRSLSGSENSDDDMSSYIRAADRIRERFNCLVCVVHHCGTDGKRPRGHSSLTGAADIQISIKRDASGIIATKVELAKDGPEGETIRSRLKEVHLGEDAAGNPISSCIIVPAGAGRDAPLVTGQDRKALDILRDTINEQGAPSPSEAQFQDGTRTVTKSAWRRACAEGGLSSGKSQGAARKAFDRSVKQLTQRGLVVVVDDIVALAPARRTDRT